MPFTYYARNKFLEAALKATNITAPTTVYVGLFTTMPALDGTGGVEVSGNAYARQAATFAAASNGTIASNADVLFPIPTPAAWGTVVGFGIFDASTSGNLWAWERIQKTIASETVVLSSGLGVLANANVANVVVKNSGETVTYTEGTDYYVLYDSGTIVRIATGSIGASDTLKITYQCPDSQVVGTSNQVKFVSGALAPKFVTFK